MYKILLIVANMFQILVKKKRKKGMNKVMNETKEPTPQVSSCHEMIVAERASFCTAPLP